MVSFGLELVVLVFNPPQLAFTSSGFTKMFLVLMIGDYFFPLGITGDDQKELAVLDLRMSFLMKGCCSAQTRENVLLQSSDGCDMNII